MKKKTNSIVAILAILGLLAMVVAPLIAVVFAN